MQAVEHPAVDPHAADPSTHTMYLLGRIGAIICHECGSCADTAVLHDMASRPAEGFWLAISGMDAACAPLRGRGRVLLAWKRKEVARLSRGLTQPLPASASTQAQMPFWAGYCQYWNELLRAHVESEDRAEFTAHQQAKQLNA
jgi:hypothetical protein